MRLSGRKSSGATTVEIPVRRPEPVTFDPAVFTSRQ